MNALLIVLASMVRHIVVTGLFWVVAFMKMPESVKTEVVAAGDFVAPIIVTFLTWVVLKYGKIIFQKMGVVTCVLFAFSLSAFCLNSCVVKVDPVTNRPVLSADPVILAQAVGVASNSLMQAVEGVLGVGAAGSFNDVTTVIETQK
ncbi:MAG: hypothetical protein ACSHX0_06930 [Akkermansiaceae bacterium]